LYSEVLAFSWVHSLGTPHRLIGVSVVGTCLQEVKMLEAVDWQEDCPFC